MGPQKLKFGRLAEAAAEALIAAATRQMLKWLSKHPLLLSRSVRPPPH